MTPEELADFGKVDWLLPDPGEVFEAWKRAVEAPGAQAPWVVRWLRRTPGGENGASRYEAVGRAVVQHDAVLIPLTVCRRRGAEDQYFSVWRISYHESPLLVAYLDDVDERHRLAHREGIESAVALVIDWEVAEDPQRWRAAARHYEQWVRPANAAYQEKRRQEFLARCFGRRAAAQP